MDLLGRACTKRKHESERYWREAWMAKDIPSIYLDLFSARKTWEGIDEAMLGNLLGVADRAMPLMEKLDAMGEPMEHITMRVISVTQGYFDNGVYNITKDTFRR